MHGPVQIIGLYWSIDCRNLYCAIITQASEQISASSAFFMLTIIKPDKENYTHTHTHKKTPASLYPHTHKDTKCTARLFLSFPAEMNHAARFAQCETGCFSSQPCSSLSNPSVVEKALCKPFSVNPPPSKSSTRLSVPDSGTLCALVSVRALVWIHISVRPKNSQRVHFDIEVLNLLHPSVVL